MCGGPNSLKHPIEKLEGPFSRITNKCSLM